MEPGAVPTAGPRLTARGRDTRRRIVEATAHQILAAGIGGTTLDTVGAETLTSKSQLFHYFPGGKNELVRAVADWEAMQLLAAQEPEIHDLSTWDSWERWRTALFDYYVGLGRWACPIGTLAMQAAMADPGLEQAIAAGFTQWRELLAAGVRRMQDRGHIDPGAHPDRLAASLIAAIEGGLLLSQPERASWPLEAALDQAFAALRGTRTSAG